MFKLDDTPDNRLVTPQPSDVPPLFIANPVRVRCCLLGGVPCLQLDVVDARGEAVSVYPKLMSVRLHRFD